MYFVIHSLIATVAAAVGVGGVEFFMFYLFFLGTVLSSHVFFCPAAEVTTTTEAEYGVIVI